MGIQSKQKSMEKVLQEWKRQVGSDGSDGVQKRKEKKSNPNEAWRDLVKQK